MQVPTKFGLLSGQKFSKMCLPSSNVRLVIKFLTAVLESLIMNLADVEASAGPDSSAVSDCVI